VKNEREQMTDRKDDLRGILLLYDCPPVLLLIIHDFIYYLDCLYVYLSCGHCSVLCDDPTLRFRV